MYLSVRVCAKVLLWRSFYGTKNAITRIHKQIQTYTHTHPGMHVWTIYKMKYIFAYSFIWIALGLLMHAQYIRKLDGHSYAPATFVWHSAHGYVMPLRWFGFLVAALSCCQLLINSYLTTIGFSCCIPYEFIYVGEYVCLILRNC